MSRFLRWSDTGGGAFPPMPTRAQVCGARLTFQGLTVTTQQLGTKNWFELMIQSLTSPSDRQAVYAAKHAQGDSHLIIEFFGSDEAAPGVFLALVEEIIANGFIPIIAYNGDNADDPTDGYPNALRQLPILAALLRSSSHGDLNARVLCVRFWDGVFYGSTAENIQNFGTVFRQTVPNGYLGIEHNSGHIPVGNGAADWVAGGLMDGYDTLFSEYDDSDQPDQGNGTIWQVVARCIQPYHRPPDQPNSGPDWDPTPPFYLVPNSRGPRYYCAFEWNTKFGAYAWTHGWVSAATIQIHRQYFTDMGCPYTG